MEQRGGQGFFIHIYYYDNNVTFYHTNSNYLATLQGRHHGERKDNEYPVVNKKTQNIKLTKTTLRFKNFLKELLLKKTATEGASLNSCF